MVFGYLMKRFKTNTDARCVNFQILGQQALPFLSRHLERKLELELEVRMLNMELIKKE